MNNSNDKVNLFNCALGEGRGQGEIHKLNQLNSGGARIIKNENGEVSVYSLDELLGGKLNRLDLIKIDVEGMEIEVLKGAKEILSIFKQLLYIEAPTTEEFDCISAFLSSYGYKSKMKFNFTPTYLFSVN